MRAKRWNNEKKRWNMPMEKRKKIVYNCIINKIGGGI